MDRGDVHRRDQNRPAPGQGTADPAADAVPVVLEDDRRGPEVGVRVPAVDSAGAQPRAGADRSARGAREVKSLAAAALLLTLVMGVSAAPRVPDLLSETGLYVVSGLSRTTLIDPRNRSFAPQYPLWSDGARKSRWVQLPPGAT